MERFQLVSSRCSINGNCSYKLWLSYLLHSREQYIAPWVLSLLVLVRICVCVDSSVSCNGHESVGKTFPVSDIWVLAELEDSARFGYDELEMWVWLHGQARIA